MNTGWVTSAESVRTDTVLDSDRMDELYRLHADSLLRYLRTKVFLDPQTAEDILQETLLRAWRTPRVFQGNLESCRNWLVTVARNLVIDWLRQRGRRPEVPSDQQIAHFPAWQCDVERSTTRMTIQSAMATLTPVQREIVEQLYFLERSHHEVAAALDIPVGTVKSRLHTALEALRRQLGEQRTPKRTAEMRLVS